MNNKMNKFGVPLGSLGLKLLRPRPRFTMICLQDCCEQEPDPTAAQSALAPTCSSPASWDVELPEEPPELAVNGLEAMSFVNGAMSDNSSVAQVEGEPSFDSFQSYVSERIRVTDAEILRGITLRESLRRGGSLWWKNPEQLTEGTRAKLYQKSRLMQHLDIFISHTWASGGWSKALSLLMQSGCKIALIFWFLGIVLAALLCHADILPMPYGFPPGTERFSKVCPLGPWVMFFGTFGTLAGLMLSPYWPRRKPMDMCFIDAACVHQTDETLMKRGIHGIGGFLLVSKELRIIWSPIYLTRLWCVFEVATYKKVNPEGAVVLAPIFLETVVILFYSANFIGAAAYFFIRGGGAGSHIAIPAIPLCCLPYLVTIHNLRRNYVQKHRLFAQLENFDLDSVECSNEADRNFVYAAITQLYGSKEAFTSYVKGPLREELLRPIAYSVGPQKYALLIVSPIASMLLDFSIALWKGGAPPDVILLYAVSMVVLGVLLFHRTSISLAILLSDHFAEPVCSSICVDLLQTFLIFLVFLLHFALGSALCLGAFFNNQWLLVPGICILFALVHILVTWLQRKSNARRLTSKS